MRGGGGGGGPPSPGGGGRPGSQKQRKRWLIHRALTSDPVDVAGLRQAAVSRGGLLADELRQKAWPKLLGVDAYGAPRKPGRDARRSHRDCSQVRLDVRRSARRFPPGMPEKQRQVLQEQLIDVILHVLRAHPELHYYQGYHDIAVTLLLVSGERVAVALLERLSTHHLRDFMDPTIDSTKHILSYLMPILQHESPQLHDFMQRAEVGTIFALSWLITWFGHVLANFHHVLRLYDFFLASHPLMAVYFAAVIVLYREEEVLSCDCDMPSIHQLLSRFPQDLPYETLIVQAHQLFQRLPHTELTKQAALQLYKRRGGSAGLCGEGGALRLAALPSAPSRHSSKQHSANAQMPSFASSSGGGSTTPAPAT